MNQLLDKIFDRPVAQILGIWALVVLIFGFICYKMLYSGQSMELAELRLKGEKLNAEIVTEQRLARDLPKMKEAVKEAEKKFEQALKELPDKREIDQLLASIASLAKVSGLQVNLFKPKPESFREFYAEVPVSISVEGDYHQVATFFDEVGRLKRIVNISEISMKDPLIEEGDNKSILKTNCTATTFRYLDESERPKVDKVDDKKKAVSRKR